MLTRILSALVLVPAVFGCVWFLPPWALLIVAGAVLTLAFLEYARLAEAGGAHVPRVAALVAALAACASVALAIPLELALVAALVALGATVLGSRRPGPGVLSDVAAATFPVLYLGVPIGTLVALRASAGREAVLLLLMTIIVSDSAQYYAGRLFGRHRLAPLISPKKTVEGALGGFVAAPVVLALVGRAWLPAVHTPFLLLVGLVLVALGVVGDLFESLLKRSVDIKDSSGLIPGHGGVLDRIDALLFAAPVFYVLLKYGG
jgi:phosphatidate cytidylyltransferase